MVKRFKCGEHIIYVRNNDFYTADVVDGKLCITITHPNVPITFTNAERIAWMVKEGYLYVKTKEGVRINFDKYFKPLFDRIETKQKVNSDLKYICKVVDGNAVIPMNIIHMLNSGVVQHLNLTYGDQNVDLNISTLYRICPEVTKFTKDDSFKWMKDNKYMDHYINGKLQE